MAEGTKMRLGQARLIAKTICMALEPYVDRIEIAGSIRRCWPEVNDIDIVLIPKGWALHKIREAVMGWLPGTDDILSNAPDYPYKWGPKLATFNYQGMAQVDLYFADAVTWPVLLLIRTGSKEHNVFLCTTAKNRGMKLCADGSGIYRDHEGTERVEAVTEGDIYGALDLPYFEPVDRSGTDWRLDR